MHTESAHAKSASPEWIAFIARFEAAETELSQGRPDAFKALWSHSSDVSIYGAFGGMASGWNDVGTRLDWAGRQFSEGTRSREERACTVGADLAYIAQTDAPFTRDDQHTVIVTCPAWFPGSLAIGHFEGKR